MAELTGGLAISEWTWKLVHGSPKLPERAILKVGVIDVTLAVRVHLELAKTLGAVISGLGRVAAQYSCLAGADLTGRTGIASAAIKERSSGGEFPLGKRGSPLIRPTKI